ncbi:hypothetical protein Zmor_027714 [Zophobas morio]|uniref:Uncharacterized protein n=1 Tax=Zophobas morio TaxID=2755281 RepID=A0AA38M3A4_9CUCU|nr:hypothetical protein Zmor_027714 [Zophobas morio]
MVCIAYRWRSIVVRSSVPYWESALPIFLPFLVAQPNIGHSSTLKICIPNTRNFIRYSLLTSQSSLKSWATTQEAPNNSLFCYILCIMARRGYIVLPASFNLALRLHLLGILFVVIFNHAVFS